MPYEVVEPQGFTPAPGLGRPPANYISRVGLQYCQQPRPVHLMKFRSFRLQAA